MWRELKGRFTPVSVEAFHGSFIGAGFAVTTTVETGFTSMTKTEWYSKIRRRIFTVLLEFSDEEIKVGIKELNKEWLPEKKEDDTLRSHRLDCTLLLI